MVEVSVDGGDLAESPTDHRAGPTTGGRRREGSYTIKARAIDDSLNMSKHLIPSQETITVTAAIRPTPSACLIRRRWLRYRRFVSKATPSSSA